MKKLFLIALMAACFQVTTAQNSAKIDFELQQEMSLRDAGDLIRINIIMNQQYDQMEMRTKASVFPNKAAKRAFVIDELKRFSAEAQQGVMTLLSDLSATSAVAEVQALWIANFINCYASTDAIEELSLHPDVLLIVFDKEYYMLPEEGTQELVEPTREIVANVLKVKADQVWALGYEGEGVVVAVIDTGVNYNHNDLKTHLWEHPDYPYHGWDFINNDNDPKDDNGHGTHCAGTVAGDGASGSKTGVAPKATIMALKVLGAGGSGPTSGIISAIQFAVAHGADVLSLSLGSSGSGGDPSSRNAMKNAMEAGVIAAVAAGNDGGDQGQYPIPKNIGSPGNCPPPWLHPDQTTTGGTSAVVCVGSTNNSDAISWFSSRGPVTWQNTGFNDYPYNPGMGLIRPDVCAPGENIKSLSHSNNSGYVQWGWSGTSMATPCVAGAMALMLSKNPTLDPADICEILETTAVHLPTSTSPKNNNYGSGRIDALEAINATPIYIEDIMFEGFTINDSQGNNNGRLNPGETAYLAVTMRNHTDQPINNVIITLKTTDGMLTIVNNEADFGNFAANETKTLEEAFTVKLSDNAASEHILDCTIEAAFEGMTRKTKIKITVYDWILDFMQARIPNKDEITIGETSDVWIYLNNKGNEIAQNLVGTITTTSSYLIINEGTAYYGQLYPDQYKHRAYNFTISPETPSGTTYLPYTLTVTEESGRKYVTNQYFRFKNLGQPPASCNPVENLAVEITDATAVLTWSAPTGAPEKYLIYCNNEFLDETTATTYTQTGIVGGNYRYCVEALYPDGCTSELTCTENTLPCELTIELTAEGVPDTGIILSWLPVVEGAKFNLYRDAQLLATVEDNTYTDAVSDPDQRYCYTVTAICAGNTETEPSNEECLSVITAINEMDHQIKIYPNPTTGELTICDMRYEICDIAIFDVMGRTVLQSQTAPPPAPFKGGEFRTSHITFDLSNVPTGIYFLRITTENGVIVRKVIKE
ncbi:MAG: S8 family serine peptidase [Bacteroidales bacterium]|nr:S8 family serine peptidase [Bacteroidales bacterium]